jgi:hypothetical protein
MFYIKPRIRPQRWFWIQPPSDKPSGKGFNQNPSEIEPEPDMAARRKIALQVEEDLRRIKEKIYLLRPNVF